MTWLKTAVIAAVVTVGVAVAVFVLHRGSQPDQAATSATEPATVPPSTPETLPTVTASAPPAPAGWVGTWATALHSGTTTFQSRTVRQIVHTSIGGDTARLRLSNRFGTEPLVVRDIHLARSAGADTVDTSTDTAVTFDGERETTIAAGEAAASDPVRFPVAALADVAVSFYLPGTSGPSTFHGFGNRDNYLADGDQAAAEQLDGSHRASSFYFLAGLDVLDRAGVGAVVTLGASVTDGFGSTFGTHRRWPDLLARRLADAGRTVSVLNAGISGNKLLVNGSGPSALARFDSDVLAQPGVRWVIISDEALNDLGSAEPPSAEELTEGLAELVGRAHESGIKAVCSTLTPFRGAGYWTNLGEEGRRAVNDFVREPKSACDGVVDQDAATNDRDAPTRLRAAFDSGDHLHPNDAGMRAIADAVDLTTFD